MFYKVNDPRRDVLLFVGERLVNVVDGRHPMVVSNTLNQMSGPVLLSRRDGDLPDVAPWQLLRSDSRWEIDRCVACSVVAQPSLGGRGEGEVRSCGVQRHRDPAQANINIFINLWEGGIRL